MLKRYENLAGTSGVVAYELLSDGLGVKFSDGAIYTYTHRSAGRANIERMKLLAQSGKGLGGYIARQVREQYTTKTEQ